MIDALQKCRATAVFIYTRGPQPAVRRTLVLAPFDSTVAEVNAELGEFVTPSPPGIPTLPPIDLLDRSCLTVSAPIDEVDAVEQHCLAGSTLSRPLSA